MTAKRAALLFIVLALPVTCLPDGVITSSATIRPDSTQDYGYEIKGRQVPGVSVAYIIPEPDDQNAVFDISPKGSPGDFTANTGVAWIDLLSTDIEADGTNYEALRLGIFALGDAHISHAKGGTGQVRNLRFQINGGNVGIGVTSTPTHLLTLNGTTSPGILFEDGGTDKMFIGQATAAGDCFTNAADGDHCFRGMGGSILFGSSATPAAWSFGIGANGSLYNPTHTTTSNPPNCFIDPSSGRIQRSSVSMADLVAEVQALRAQVDQLMAGQ